MIHSPIRAYAKMQRKTLLRKFREQAVRTAKRPGPDEVHDLRVSIRRLVQCLRVFGQFFPIDRTRKKRRGLKRLLELAAEVRDRDVMIEFLEGAGIAQDDALAKDRARAERRLRAGLRKHKL